MRCALGVDWGLRRGTGPDDWNIDLHSNTCYVTVRIHCYSGVFMPIQAKEIQKYLALILGTTVSPSRWPGAKRLPLFLRDKYTFYQAKLLEVPCLFLVATVDDEASPATIRKHCEQIHSKWDGEIIYVREQIAAYQRNRLISQKVPFLVPGNQMYLPMLGIDLREHFRTLRRSGPSFSPATQVVVLHLLLRQAAPHCTPNELAKTLGYSKMTMTRAFNELEAEKMVVIETDGRTRCLRLIENRKELWERSKEFLRNPVRHRHVIRAKGKRAIGKVAGLSALSEYSMLASPRTPVVAWSHQEWSAAEARTEVETISADEPGAVEVEVWNYDPGLFANRRIVDRLSLYLSLRATADERVERALEEMMEGQKW